MHQSELEKLMELKSITQQSTQSLQESKPTSECDLQVIIYPHIDHSQICHNKEGKNDSFCYGAPNIAQLNNNNQNPSQICFPSKPR